VPTDRPTSDPRLAVSAAIDVLARGVDLDAILDGILSAADIAVSPAMSAIIVADPDRDGLQVAAAHGMDAAATDRLADEIRDPSHPFTAATTTGEATFDRASVAAGAGPSVGAYLPLTVVSGGVELSLGSIGFGWPAPRDVDAQEQEALLALASLAALAIERARLASTVAERSEWFERMAHTDPLTGLANERTIGRILEAELVRAGRQGGEVSLALFDVDDFQATNRDGGHAAGDDVLRQVAAVLAESVRLVDTVGRVGGDEFVLIAPGPAGAVVAQRVLSGIAALPAIGGRPITVSAGVARFPADGTEAQALIAAATDGLARARREGRGTVSTGVGPDA
jgi:diguanylate cyclase (GGDEF)-like protein